MFLAKFMQPLRAVRGSSLGRVSHEDEVGSDIRSVELSGREVSEEESGTSKEADMTVEDGPGDTLNVRESVDSDELTLSARKRADEM